MPIIKVTVPIFSSVSISYISPYRTRLFVKKFSRDVLTIFCLVPNVSIYQIVKLLSASNGTLTNTSHSGNPLTPVFIDPDNILTISFGSLLLLRFFKIRYFTLNL